MTTDLEAICDTCGLPVTDGEGVLHVSFAAIHAYETARGQHVGVADTALTIAALMALPRPAPWRVDHHTCRPADPDGYSIDVAEVRTWRALLMWSAHLMGKQWLAATNWAAVIGAAARGGTGRGLTPARVRGEAV